MKKLILLCIVLTSLYLPGYAQSRLLDQKVSLQSREATIEEVLQKITLNYKVPFSYSKDLIPLQQKVSIQASNQTLSEVLDKIFTDTGIEFILIGEQVVLKKIAAAQEPGVIRGRVIDKNTKEPLSFASIQISGKAIGATTLASGEFKFNILPQYLHDTLLITYMGYKPVQKPIAASLNQTMQVQLEQETKQLDEVVVQSITGLSILQHAIAKIPENYDTTAFNLSFFLREWVFHDGRPIRVNEAVYEGYRGPLNQHTIKQTKLINNRNRKYYTEYQAILSAFPHWTGYEVTMNRKAIFDDVTAFYMNKENFLVPAGYRYHDFLLSGTIRMNGREVYVINFDQKDKYRHKALYKGTLYIDVASMAIVKSVVELSPKGIKNVRFFNSPKAAALLLGFGKCAVTSNQVTTTYKEQHGKWYVDSLQTIYETHLVKDKRDYDSFVYYKADVVVTSVRKDYVTPFATSDETTNLELHQEQYDKNFWKNYTAVKPSQEFEFAFNQIDSLNKLHPYHDKFWKRYKMDKHPAVAAITTSPADRKEQKHALSDDLLLPLTERKETKHFRFIYTAIDTASIDVIAANLEDNYNRIVTDLEVNKQPKVEVTIYPSIRAYHLAINNLNAPDHEVGAAISSEAFRIISPNNPGPVWNYEFIMKAFIHEFTHCVHYTILEGLNTKELSFILGNDSQGAWLAEALACYEAGQFFPPAKFEYLQQGNYPTLSQLSDEGKVYDIGYVIIDYIRIKWGMKTLNQLIRTNGSIQSCLGISERAFQTGLYAYIEQKYLQ